MVFISPGKLWGLIKVKCLLAWIYVYFWYLSGQVIEPIFKSGKIGNLARGMNFAEFLFTRRDF